MRVEKDFEDFIAFLNEYKVRYLIIGGYAVSFHSEPRYTGDIDFWIDPTKENAVKILRVLKKFGFKELDINVESFCDPNNVIQLGFEPVRIDLITSVDVIQFADAYRLRRRGKLGEQSAYFISFEHLIKTKEATNRPQDIADVRKLLMFKRKNKRNAEKTS